MQTELQQFLERYPDTEVVEVLLADISGVVRGKQIPIADLAALYAGEIVLPRATVLLDTLGEASEEIPYGIQDGDPDRALLPVPGTLHPMSWSARPAAQVLTQVSDAPQTPWFANPRAVLEHVLGQVHQAGFTPVVAIELEFQVLDAMSAPADFLGPQTYNLDHLREHREIVSAIESACRAQHLPIGSVFSEYGDGQFEINLAHTEAVATACDQALLLRRLVRRVAREQQRIASFMAVPTTGNAGNGLHVHVSLLDSDGHNVFSRAADEEGSPGIETLSELALQAVRGLQELMAESMALFAPNANSYQRLQPGNFAPVKADWGLDHRAVALRIPHARGANTRIEHRTAGADANPYLVVAAILAGLLHGVDAGQTATLGSTPEGQATTPLATHPLQPHHLELPNRWQPAIDRFAASDRLAHYLGPEFCALYAQVKRDEEARYQRQLEFVDRQHYLRVI